jgi:L-ascorbate metabolism protein UlaG (beta-lactamase superfamily)
MSEAPQLTYIGGPTLLIEWQGLRLLTDPTFDPADTSYPTPAYTLHKTIGPALAVNRIGSIDAVLLSHDHHFDNLDNAGRQFLPSAGQVLTTRAGAERLGGNARGLTAGDSVVLTNPTGHRLRVTATAARHGPADGDRGPVIGFLLNWESDASGGIYLSGDTVLYQGLDQVLGRGPVQAVVAFAGAAKVKVAGDHPLTLTASESVEVARKFAPATIVPLHFEGWEHFSETRADLARAFEAAGLSSRLQWLTPGQATPLRR